MVKFNLAFIIGLTVCWSSFGLAQEGSKKESPVDEKVQNKRDYNYQRGGRVVGNIRNWEKFDIDNLRRSVEQRGGSIFEFHPSGIYMAFL